MLEIKKDKLGKIYKFKYNSERCWKSNDKINVLNWENCFSCNFYKFDNVIFICEE